MGGRTLRKDDCYEKVHDSAESLFAEERAVSAGFPVAHFGKADIVDTRIAVSHFSLLGICEIVEQQQKNIIENMRTRQKGNDWQCRGKV